MQFAGGDVEGFAEGKPGRVRNDDMPKRVHATAPRSASHLLELIRDQHATAAAIPFAHTTDDDRARWHVYAESEGIGGEDDLHQPASEKHLDELLQNREQTCVVEADSLARQGRHCLNLLQFPVFG